MIKNDGFVSNRVGGGGVFRLCVTQQGLSQKLEDLNISAHV
jgi:hypothetical protein